MSATQDRLDREIADAIARARKATTYEEAAVAALVAIAEALEGIRQVLARSVVYVMDAGKA